jgi:hypothetical protein
MTIKMAFNKLDLIWYGIVFATLAVTLYKYLSDKTRQKRGFKRFLSSNTGKAFYGIAMIGLVGASLTAANPITDTDVTQWFGALDPYTDPNGGHLKYLGAKECYNVKMTFDIQDGYDVDGNYAGTEADAITVTVYGAGSIGASVQASAKGIEWATGEGWDLFVNNVIDQPTWLELSGLTAIESKAASSGVFTSDLAVYNSKVEYILELGTYNPDETGDDPLRSQFVHGILQGDNSADQPSGGCRFGMGVVKYWGHVDEDDLTIVLETKNKAAFSGNSVNDWSDDTDNIFELAFELTWDSDGKECGLHSYYQQAENRWWHWYIAVDLGEKNCTSLVSAEFDFNFGYASGFATDTDGAYGYVQLSTGKLYTDNNRPNSIANLFDASGDNIDGYLNVQWFLWDLDINSLTSAGGTDNYEEISIDIDLGTDYNVAAILADGQLRDDSTANNTHISGSATYYVVT